MSVEGRAGERNFASANLASRDKLCPTVALSAKETRLPFRPPIALVPARWPSSRSWPSSLGARLPIMRRILIAAPGQDAGLILGGRSAPAAAPRQVSDLRWRGIGRRDPGSPSLGR